MRKTLGIGTLLLIFSIISISQVSNDEKKTIIGESDKQIASIKVNKKTFRIPTSTDEVEDEVENSEKVVEKDDEENSNDAEECKKKDLNTFDVVEKLYGAKFAEILMKSIDNKKAIKELKDSIKDDEELGDKKKVTVSSLQKEITKLKKIILSQSETNDFASNSMPSMMSMPQYNMNQFGMPQNVFGFGMPQNGFGFSMPMMSPYMSSFSNPFAMSAFMPQNGFGGSVEASMRRNPLFNGLNNFNRNNGNYPNIFINGSGNNIENNSGLHINLAPNGNGSIDTNLNNVNRVYGSNTNNSTELPQNGSATVSAPRVASPIAPRSEATFLTQPF